jgi:hypothetical protein
MAAPEKVEQALSSDESDARASQQAAAKRWVDWAWQNEKD